MPKKRDKLTWNQVIEIIEKKNAGGDVASGVLLLRNQGGMTKTTDGFPIVDVGSQTLSGTLSVVVELDPEDEEALAPLYNLDAEDPYSYEPDYTLEEVENASDA